MILQSRKKGFFFNKATMLFQHHINYFFMILMITSDNTETPREKTHALLLYNPFTRSCYQGPRTAVKEPIYPFPSIAEPSSHL